MFYIITEKIQIKCLKKKKEEEEEHFEECSFSQFSRAQIQIFKLVLLFNTKTLH